VALLAVLAVAAAVGVVFSLNRMQSRESSGPDLGFAPGFTLTDADSATFRSTDLAGKVWLVDFFFTRCRGTCPILTGRMLEAQGALQEHAGWRLVSITVDPEHDTPSVLRAHAEATGMDPERWVLLTGDKTEVTKLVQQGFLLPLSRVDDAVEPVLHSTRILLVDRRGAIRGHYDALDDDAMAALPRDAIRLLNEKD
jgi:cytochrome oxidase Cu insertion factor (SCO1/SenC/PrrC family)